MSEFNFPEDFELTANQAAQALDLSHKRVVYICNENPSVCRRTSQKSGSHIRIPVANLQRIKDLDEIHRKKGRTGMASRARITALQEQVDQLKERLEHLEKYALLDEEAQVARPDSLV